MILKFRVVADVEEDVFRDIEIEETQSFETLHNAILKAFDYSGSQLASFYISNDNWDKGQEIGLMDMELNQDSPTMHTAVLEDFMMEANQKLVYVYDFLNMLCFYVELIETSKPDAAISYPNLALSVGEAPLEENSSKEDHVLTDVENSNLSAYDAELEDILRQDADEDIDPFAEGSFESIDDLDI